MAVTIASIHYIYPWRDGQAELASVAWSNTKTVHLQTVTHLSANLARRKVTSLTWLMALSQSQAHKRISVLRKKHFKLCYRPWASTGNFGHRYHLGGI